MYVHKHAYVRVWGYAPPGKFLQIRYSEIASCYLYGFAYMILIRTDVQCHTVAVAAESNMYIVY